MFAYCILLFICLTSTVCGLEQNETEFERINAFHALGKCSHQKCENENKAFTDIIEKTSDLQRRIERCSKCRTKKFEELNDVEKRVLVNCIKVNDCETSSKFHEKYKESQEFKDLLKCLESKCPNEYKSVLKYKTFTGAATTDASSKKLGDEPTSAAESDEKTN